MSDKDPFDSIDDMNQEMNNLIKNESSKIGKKIARQIGKGAKILASKAAAALVHAIIATISLFLPFILVALGLLLIFVLAFSVLETRGDMQQYSFASENDYERDDIGRIIYDEKGTSKLKKVQFESQLIDDFYTYIGSQSYYRYVPETGELLSPDELTEEEKKEKEKAEKEGKEFNFPRDYLEREKEFSLNSNMLFALDERMFEEKFIYSEQFIKPVRYKVNDENNIELAPLTDENGFIIAESKELDEKTGLETGKTMKSVRDYGLGSIMQYMKAKRTLHIEGRYVKQEKWVQAEGEEGKIVLEDIDEPFNFKNEPFEEKEIHLLTRVVMFAGEIIYEYGEPEPKEFGTLSSGVASPENMPFDKYQYDTADVYGYVEKTVYDDLGNPIGTETVWEVVGKKDLYKYRSDDSVVIETMPRANASQSVDKGLDYIYSYLNHFEAYVPQDVVNGFDFKSRIDYESHIFTDIDYDNIQVGNKTEGSKSWSETKDAYFDIMEKWAEEFGVDPYIILAMAMTESGGDHEGNMQRCKFEGQPACGLMQIEKPGVVITQLQAYNKNNELITMVITGPESVESVEDNIKAGVMEFKARLDDYEGNYIMAIQAYNYGPGGMNAVLNLYADYKLKAQGNKWPSKKDKEEMKQAIIRDHNDLGWVNFLEEVHKNPSKYFKWDYPTFGTPNHFAKVLSYYGGEQTFGGITDVEIGANAVISIPQLESNLTQDVIASGGNKGFWSNMGDAINSFLRPSQKDKDKKDEPVPVFEYFKKVDDYFIDELLTMGKTMNNETLFSEEYLVGERKNLTIFDEGFIGSLGSAGTSYEDLIASNPNAAGFVSPLNVSKNIFDCITSPFGELRGGKAHVGVDFGANKSGVGQDLSNPAGIIRAAKAGKVELAQWSNSAGNWVIIDHGDGIQTVYMHLNSLSVSKGQIVETGDPIGIMGNTGNSQGRHLHFELRINGQRKDPMSLYKKEE